MPKISLGGYADPPCQLNRSILLSKNLGNYQNCLVNPFEDFALEKCSNPGWRNVLVEPLIDDDEVEKNREVFEHLNSFHNPIEDFALEKCSNPVWRNFSC